MSDAPTVTPSAAIAGLLVIEPGLHEDERGAFVESFNSDDWRFTRPDGSAIEFVEDDYSSNRRGVLRGFHGDDRTWKLVHCPAGEAHVVVVDMRPDSATRAEHEAYRLGAGDPKQLLIPAGCATGFQALADDTVFVYKQSARYQGQGGQFSIRWNDPDLGVIWPIADPILSSRDADAPPLTT